MDPWCEKHNGVCEIIRGPDHMVELLAHLPKTWRVSLRYKQDRNVDPQTSDTVLSCEIDVLLDAYYHIDSNPGRSYTARSGDTALLNRLADVRGLIKGFRPDWAFADHNRMYYLGCRDVISLPNGYAVAGYTATYMTYYQADNEPYEQVMEDQ